MFVQQTIHLLSSAQQHPQLALATAVIGLVLSYLLCNEVVRYKARLAQFNGPRGLPIVGNLHQLQTNAAQRYREWAKTYGSVFQIQLGNIPILVVNSSAAARTIFGGHSGATASRPEFYTFHKASQTLVKHYIC